jgi:hypothetical protein
VDTTMQSVLSVKSNLQINYYVKKILSSKEHIQNGIP